MQKMIAKCKPGNVIVVGKKMFVMEVEQPEDGMRAFQPVRGGAVTYFGAGKIVEVRPNSDDTFPTNAHIASVEKLVEFLIDQAEWSDEELDALRASFYKSVAAFNRQVAKYDESMPSGFPGSYKNVRNH